MNEYFMNVLWTFILAYVSTAEMYSEPCQTPTMELFAKIVNG